jgi:hypothetical protein
MLFEPAVDYGAIKKYIGKSAFKANLPKKKFDVDDRKLPVISNEINDAIEPPPAPSDTANGPTSRTCFPSKCPASMILADRDNMQFSGG